ncbi:hypothetical protein ACFL27_10115, partial [candidate division CSSED10-310 bacterium]
YRNASWRTMLICLGLALPLSGLALYNHHVFEDFFMTGYQLQSIRPHDTTFIFQQIARGYYGQAFGTIIRNAAVLPEILMTGIPWIILLPPAMVWGRKNLDRKLYIFLSGWILSNLLVYLQYRMLMPHTFVIISRMYLPLVGPSAILVAAYCEQLGKFVPFIVCLFTVMISLMFFAFYLHTIHIPFFTIDLTTYFGSIQEVVSVYYPG